MSPIAEIGNYITKRAKEAGSPTALRPNSTDLDIRALERGYYPSVIFREKGKTMYADSSTHTVLKYLGAQPERFKDSSIVLYYSATDETEKLILAAERQAESVKKLFIEYGFSESSILIRFWPEVADTVSVKMKRRM